MNNLKNSNEKSIPSSPNREVLTFRFNTDLVEQIDEFIYQNRKQLPFKKRKKLNRTTIVGIILQDVYGDWAKFGNNSYLFRLLSKWIDE